MDKESIKSKIEKLKGQLDDEKEAYKRKVEELKKYCVSMTKNASSPSNVKSGASKHIKQRIIDRKASFDRNDKKRMVQKIESVKTEIASLKNKLQQLK